MTHLRTHGPPSRGLGTTPNRNQVPSFTDSLSRLQHHMGNDLTVIVFLWKHCMESGKVPTQKILTEMKLRAHRIHSEIKLYAEEGSKHA